MKQHSNHITQNIFRQVPQCQRKGSLGNISIDIVQPPYPISFITL